MAQFSSDRPPMHRFRSIKCRVGAEFNERGLVSIIDGCIVSRMHFTSFTDSLFASYIQLFDTFLGEPELEGQQA